MNSLSRIRTSLFWRISLVFLGILIFVALAYILIAVRSANRYYQETTQRLNAEVAEKMLDEVSPFVNGKVNKEALDKLMHSMMAVNPNLEIYLLDPEGKILEYVVLKKKVKLNYVDLTPIREFLEHDKDIFVLGDDPKSAGKRKIFSATRISENGNTLGYVYMILASEEYDNVASVFWNSYMLRVGVNAFIVTLTAAFAIGLLLVWLLTRNLRKIIDIFRKFEEGDLKARIPVRGNDELSRLALTFNQMADTILANIEELKQVDNLRRELIANVSHDLRNPLSIIHGYLETLILKENSLTAAEKEKYMQIVMKNTTRLRKQVGELFELSKLEARQVRLNPEPFGMAELLQDVTAKFQLQARQKGIKIETSQEELNQMVYADLALMERVLQNLLDNAIRYSPDQENIKISLKQKGQLLEFSIVNSGVGIPAPELPKIFDRYYRSGNQANGQSGTGLGLAIVKNILELHDSQIEVTSEPDKYTRFFFTLPVYFSNVPEPAGI